MFVAPLVTFISPQREKATTNFSNHTKNTDNNHGIKHLECRRSYAHRHLARVPRVCLLYSLFFGLIGIYALNVIAICSDRTACFTPIARTPCIYTLHSLPLTHTFSHQSTSKYNECALHFPLFVRRIVCVRVCVCYVLNFGPNML